MKKGFGPILITGTFRSGTTLISQMMNSHPDIAMTYDSVNFMRFSYDRYNPISDKNNVKKLVKEIHERVSSRWNLDFDHKKVISNIYRTNKISYRLVYDTLMTEILLLDSSKKVWGEKTTLVWGKIPDFFRMFPKGRVVHIIRDPRAVLASWEKMTNAPGTDYLDSIFNCIDSMDKMDEFKNKYDKKRYTGIRFEDLVNNPEKTIRVVCEDLEIQYDRNMLNADAFTNKFGDTWKGNSMFSKKLTGISNSTISKWQGTLNDWEVWLTEFLTGRLMTKYHYKKSKIKETNELMYEAISNIKKSALVTDGAINFLITSKGLERFPTDPIDKKSWDTGRF